MHRTLSFPSPVNLAESFAMVFDKNGNKVTQQVKGKKDAQQVQGDFEEPDAATPRGMLEEGHTPVGVASACAHPFYKDLPTGSSMCGSKACKKMWPHLEAIESSSSASSSSSSS